MNCTAKFILCLLLLATAILCVHKLPGRFRIFNATYEEKEVSVIDFTVKTTPQKALFKVDTITGKTWLYEDKTTVAKGEATFESGWMVFGNKKVSHYPDEKTSKN